MRGVGNFYDLGVSIRGTGYILEFESTMGAFTTDLTFDVEYSAEYQVCVHVVVLVMTIRCTSLTSVLVVAAWF